MDIIENNDDPQCQNDHNLRNLKENGNESYDVRVDDSVKKNLCDDHVNDIERNGVDFHDDDSLYNSNSNKTNLSDNCTFNNTLIDNPNADNFDSKSESIHILNVENDGGEILRDETKSHGVSLYKKRNVIDSDSEEDDIKRDHVQDNEESEVKPYNKPRCFTICDSESSDEENQDDINLNDPKTIESSSQDKHVIDDDSEDDTKKDHVQDNEDPKVKAYNKPRSFAICDPESSDEEDQDDVNLHDPKTIESSSKGKRNKFNIVDEEKTKLTGRTALKLRKEIQSESQRMTRECSFNLPYHKPKTRTLKDFLQNRLCFTSTVPASTCKTPPSLAIKMSTEQLKAISEKLSEREKVVKEFFKSDSESEDEDVPIKSNTENKDSVEGEKAKTSANVHILQDITLKAATKDGTVHHAHITNNILLVNETFDSNDINNLHSREHLNEICNNNIHILDDTKNQLKTNNSEQIEEVSLLEQQSPNNTETQNQQLHESNSINPDIITKNSSVSEKSQNVEVTKYEIDEGSDKSRVENENLEAGKTNVLEFEKSESDSVQEAKSHNFNINVDTLIEKYTLDEFSHAKDNEGIKYIIEDKESNIKSVLDLVRNKFGDFKPELKGSSDQIIDLEDGIIKANKVDELVNRFIRHTKKRSPQKHKVKLDVIRVSSGEIYKETLEVAVNAEESIPIEEKPGHRLKILREELQKQMAQKRSELWQQKPNIKESDQNNVQKNGEMDNQESDILDDEEEDFTESEEDEDVLEDCSDIEVENEKQKSIYIDEEAEESDIDEDETDFGNNENVEGSDEMEDPVSNNDNSSQSDSERTQKKKKRLKRIIKPFSNDSEDEDNTNMDIRSNSETNTLNSNNGQEKNNLDSTDTWDENCEITPHQARNCRTPIRQRTQSRSELGFLTPVLQLTGLQSLNSQFLRDPTVSPFVMPDSSPTESAQDHSQQKIFDNIDLTTTQKANEVAELGSESISSQIDAKTSRCVNSQDETDHVGNENIQFTEDDPSTQDLLEICSGKFTGITQIHKNDKNSEIIKNNRETQNVEITLNNEITSLDPEDKLISQLLNEEELDTFKKKFESPVDDATESLVPINRVIYDSSDDENEISANKNRKQQRKFVFSDDDDGGDEKDEDSDGSEPCERIDDMESDIEPIQDVEYDSEENEIEISVEGNPRKMKITDFLENEAELSESDWGSADEDERGLDEFEQEEGDTEKLDEEQVKSDLERIHMRRLLDDDNHEVKLLQELLLDDGEMHGNGRERQFRWKNIDSSEFAGDGNIKDDDEIYIDEDEDEEKWRKMRYEREIFLKKELDKSHSIKKPDEDLLTKTNSQIIKLGHTAIKRSLSNRHNLSVISEKTTDTITHETKESNPLLSKRGSFLSRSDEVLQRVAILTKTVPSAVTGNKKSSRNFVFQTVTESSQDFVWDKKRKATDGTPNAIKKLRLSSSSPSVQKKDKTTSSSKAKRLFSVW